MKKTIHYNSKKATLRKEFARKNELYGDAVTFNASDNFQEECLAASVEALCQLQGWNLKKSNKCLAASIEALCQLKNKRK